MSRVKRRCCFYACKENNLTSKLYTFPRVAQVANDVSGPDQSVIDRCKLWVDKSKNVSLLRLPLESLNGKYFVCKKHFNQNQFCKPQFIVLKKDAVPESCEYSESSASSDQDLHLSSDSSKTFLGATNNCAEVPLEPHQKTINRKCCVKFCESNNTNSSLYTFPNTETIVDGIQIVNTAQVDRCKLWLEKIDNPALCRYEVRKLHKSVFVCKHHFNDDQFLTSDKNKLKNTATPNIILEPFTRNKSCMVQDSQQHSTGADLNNSPNEPTENAQNRSIFPNRKLTVKRKCCAPECTSTNLTSKLHTFPLINSTDTDNIVIREDALERLKIWVRNTGNTKLTIVNPCHLYRRYWLCSLHFEEDDYSSAGCIRSTAIPTLFSSPPLSDVKFQQFQKNARKILEAESNHSANGIRVQNSLNFEIYMQSLQWNFCQNCKEKHISTKNTKCVHGDNCGNFTEANSMDPGEVPDELKNLTFVEEQVISRVHPLISVYKLKGLQYGYTGNIINFPQSVEKFAEELPRKVSDLSSVVTVRFTDEKIEPRDFRIRKPVVLKALLWLQKNNPFYEHIRISMDNVNELPEDGNVFEQIQSVLLSANDSHCSEDKSDNVDNSHSDNKSESTDNANSCPSSDNVNSGPCEDNETSDEDCGSFSNVYQSSIFNVGSSNPDEQIKTFLDWPQIGTEPIDEFKTVGYIASAFPTLFPYGKADLRSHRLKSIKPSAYFKHLMNYHDGRFAKHQTFRYFALNSIMRWNALTNGNIFVKNNEGLNNITVEELKVLLGQQPDIIKKIMFYANVLRGTIAYWYARCNELRDMIQQLSMPTFFLTLSAADLHWPDLYRLLTDRDLDTLSEKDRRQLLQENPMIVDKFFDLRIESFIKQILEKDFQVVDYWYRIEFQHRGSPHLHGIFWLKDAPDVTSFTNETPERQAEIIQYFNKLVSAINPDPDCNVSAEHPCRTRFQDAVDEEEDTAQLLRTVQRHTRCSPDYCLRYNKKTGKQECRFKFPKDVTESSSIEVDESGKLEFRPARNDEWLNFFNTEILQTWRANMDIKPVLSKEALTAYLAKYISKFEVRSKGIEDLYSNLFNCMNDSDPAKKFIQKFLIRLCGERDISAQEVCHILLGNKLYSSGGRRFVSISLPSTQEWSPVTAKRFPDQENNECSFIKRYKNRPEALEEITLWEAAQSFNPVTWKRYTKSNIVRIYPRYRLSEDEERNENYYRQMSLLHIPWRDINTFDEKSWKQIYIDRSLQSKSTSACPLELPQIAEEEENDQDEDEENVEERPTEEWMIAAMLGPKRNLPRVELGRRDVDVNFNWNAATDCYHGSLEELKKFLPSMKVTKSDTNTTISQVPDVEFNAEQHQVIDIVQEQISEILNNSVNHRCPKRIIVQGKAGTGKSLVIKAITNLIQNKLGEDAYILLASTGIAALNIGGQTIHSFFKLPRDPSTFQNLTGESARTFNNKMDPIKFIIIDEYSMVGCTLLAMIEKRCAQAKESPNRELCGGLNVILFGDIEQLPPVKDPPVYHPQPKTLLSQYGKAVFDQFQKCIFLHQCHRQKDKRFLELLDNISSGDISENDYELLGTRFITTVPQSDIKEFSDAIRLFSTIDEVNAYNLDKLANSTDNNRQLLPVARVPAQHNCRLASAASVDDASGLEKILYLSQGCKIMLRQNIWTEKGLVNGAMGVINDILYEDEQSSPNDLPAVIMCTFPSYTGPQLIPSKKVVPIYPVTSTWTAQNGIKCTRKQYPLAVAFACSIHKSQGMTLEKAVIDIGKREFSLGLTYVALSRVKTLDGLLMHPICFDRISTLKSYVYMTYRSMCKSKLKDLQ